MGNNELWDRYFTAMLMGGMEPVLAASRADAALKEYKHRFGDD